MPGFTYGPDGLIGCATPQANGTVEPELRRLLPSTVNLQMTRSFARGDARARLRGYFEGIESTIETFGGMPLQAFGFACTGSSYLIEAEQEARQLKTLQNKFGFPIRLASHALNRALSLLGARRLLIGSPYPDWLHQACIAYWGKAGYCIEGETTARPQMQDTREIYSVDPLQVAASLEKTFVNINADALMITGTGLPTLPIRQRLQKTLKMPVLSANLCLAWDLLETTQPGSAIARQLEQSIRNASGPW